MLTSKSQTMKAPSVIKVYANSDEATIVWKYSGNIKDCWGFAIYRKHKGQPDSQAEALHTGVGFQGDPHTDGETQPSTIWPIQKYIWIDYYVQTGDVVSYRVVPMIHSGTQLQEADDKATDWSDWVTVGNPPGVEAYFNRGLVSSQFLAKRLSTVPDAEKKKTLLTNLNDVNSKIRNFMGGDLLQALYNLLKEVTDNKNLQLYGALYELNEPELIRRLNALGKRAHIILANGAFGAKDPDPQAVNAKLLTHVDLTRRIVSTPHFAHNKFMIVTDKSGTKETAVKVLTGSTNWTTNGVFTQVNNAVILHDPKVAAYYKAEWDAIKADCDQNGKGLYSKKYEDFNNSVRTAPQIKTFFTPVQKEIDLDEADSHIRAAKQGILFLMFKPGVEGKSRMLYDTIMEMSKNKQLLINGVLNGDPGTAQHPTITFMHKNQQQQGNLDVVLPASIGAAFESWMKEIGIQNVTIHSKIIVIDPFSANPVLMTGSHNMGGKASASNDDNLNIIIGNTALTQAYAINIMGVYHHYRWRFFRSRTDGSPSWEGNVKNDQWQDWYKTGDKAKEINFWLPS